MPIFGLYDFSSSRRLFQGKAEELDQAEADRRNTEQGKAGTFLRWNPLRAEDGGTVVESERTTEKTRPVKVEAKPPAKRKK